jgi:hypothetical protein
MYFLVCMAGTRSLELSYILALGLSSDCFFEKCFPYSATPALLSHFCYNTSHVTRFQRHSDVAAVGLLFLDINPLGMQILLYLVS